MGACVCKEGSRLHLIGQGTNSYVYGVNSKSVIKVYKSNSLISPVEVDILFRLSSPYLCKGLSLDKHPDFTFSFQIERLHATLESIRLTCTYHTLKKLIRDCALGLQHLHRNGYLHLDIKENNMMLTKSGVGKLIDFEFGMSIMQGGGAVYIDDLPGSPEYRCIESYYVSTYFTSKFDIWSLAISMIKLFSNNNHLFRVGDLHDQIVTKLSSKNIETTVKHLCQKIPPHEMPMFVNLMRGMLQFEPAHRYNIKDVLHHRFFNSQEEVKVERIQEEPDDIKANPNELLITVVRHSFKELSLEFMWNVIEISRRLTVIDNDVWLYSCICVVFKIYYDIGLWPRRYKINQEIMISVIRQLSGKIKINPTFNHASITELYERLGFTPMREISKNVAIYEFFSNIRC